MEDLILKSVKKSISELSPEKLVNSNLKKLGIEGEYYLIGIGKNSLDMAMGVLKSEVKIRDSLIIHPNSHHPPKNFPYRTFASSHPIPGKTSIEAGKLLFDFISASTQNSKFLLLISGGGSSLVELPVDSISLESIQKLSKNFLTKPISIKEMNIVRKVISKIKGGGLATQLFPRNTLVFLISDVPIDHPHIISSGMTYPDYSKKTEAREILSKYSIDIPEIDLFFNNTDNHEKKTINDCKHIENFVILDRKILANHLTKNLEKNGLNCVKQVDYDFDISVDDMIEKLKKMKGRDNFL